MNSATTRLHQLRRHTRNRFGRVNALWALLAGGVAVIGVSAFLLSRGGPGQAPQGQVLVMHCAAGIRVPVEEVAVEYEEKYGKIERKKKKKHIDKAKKDE